MLHPILARTRGLALAVAMTVPLLAAPSAWGLPDFDGDGAAAGDCAPADPAVFPGAADRPDLGFEDTNCDGIDGDATSAVFVSPTGDDGAPGTRESPKRTIGAALSAGREVYVAAGTYGRVEIAGEAGIYGGYAAGSWTRSRANVTTIGGAPEAILTRGATAILQLLELRGGDGAGSAYGLRAVNGSRVALSNVVAIGIDAGGGQPGAQPPPAAAGAQGMPGGCPAPGAAGGTGDSAGGLGGAGGAGSNATGSPGARGQSPTGVVPALGGPPGAAGEDGRPIDAPSDAGANAGFTLGDASEAWNGRAGAAGEPGIDGTGGGGGGGGTGGPAQAAPGAGGGGGGGGGQGGRGGLAGASGGGSFGAYLHASSLVATESKLVAGRGGNGGDGGIGGVGGDGGDGGPGSPSPACAGGTGGRGGKGGPGAPGGPGGAGPGGPSIGIFRVGVGALYTARTGTAEQAGAAGAGGLRPGVGDRADGGVARPAETANGAPETGSGDFDGDGVADATDNCPEIAALGGCPTRPPTLPDADGDQIPDGFDACPAVPRGNDPNEDGCPDGPAPPPPPASVPSPPAPTTAPRARPARVSAAMAFRFSNRGRSTVFSSLQVRRITGGATVVVRCAGKGCPVRRFIKRRAAGTLPLRPFVRKRLRAGIVLHVRVTRTGFVGLALDVAIRARRAPRVTTLCLPPGGSRTQRC